MRFSLNNPLLRTTAEIIGITLAAVFVVAWLLMPTIKDVKSFEEDVSAEHTRLEMQYARGLLIKQLRDDWAYIKDDLPTVTHALFETDNGLRFVTTIEQIAERHHLAHELTIPLNDLGVSVEHPAEIPVTIRWEGAWADVFRALHTLESAPFVIKYTALSLTPERPLGLPVSADAVRGLTLPAAPHSEGGVPTQETKTVMTLNGIMLWKNNQ